MKKVIKCGILSIFAFALVCISLSSCGKKKSTDVNKTINNPITISLEDQTYQRVDNVKIHLKI